MHAAEHRLFCGVVDSLVTFYVLGNGDSSRLNRVCRRITAVAVASCIIPTTFLVNQQMEIFRWHLAEILSRRGHLRFFGEGVFVHSLFLFPLAPYPPGPLVLLQVSPAPGLPSGPLSSSCQLLPCFGPSPVILSFRGCPGPLVPWSPGLANYQFPSAERKEGIKIESRRERRKDPNTEPRPS